MINIVAICGQSGSGKDTVINSIQSKHPDWKRIIPTTTRPKREKEVDGVDYYFLTLEEYAEKLGRGGFIEVSSFNGWMYGTDWAEIALSESNVLYGIFNPTSIKILLTRANKDIKVWTIYLQAPENIRLSRQLLREDNPNVSEILRRYKTDKRDFEGFEYIADYIIDTSGTIEMTDKHVEEFLAKIF